MCEHCWNEANSSYCSHDFRNLSRDNLFIRSAFLPGIWKDRDHIALALGELLAALIFILIGLLCLKDVVKIIRALRASRSNPSLISNWPITASPPDAPTPRKV
jgi:hypothetical protein